MTKEEARSKALATLAEKSIRSGYSLVLLEDFTEWSRCGWVFYYQTQQYVATGDIVWRLGGNGPLLVDERTGTVIELGSALSLEENLVELERTRGDYY